MSKHLLEVLLLPKNELPPMIFRLSEDMIDEKVTIIRDGKREDSWAAGYVTCIGKGISLRVVHFDVTEPATVFCRPLEPVVTLHIQLKNEAYGGFDGDGRHRLWAEAQCVLFRQGNAVVETYMLPGKHTQLDLYFRPEVFEALTGSLLLDDLKDRMKSEVQNRMDLYTVAADSQTIRFLLDMVKWVNTSAKPDMDKFHRAAHKLLLLCLGEEIEAEDWATETVVMDGTPTSPAEPAVKPDKGRANPKTADARMPLSRRFKTLYKAMTERRNRLAATQKRAETALEKSMVQETALMTQFADVFLKFARLFAEEMEKSHWTKQQKDALQKGINTTCNHAFAIRSPTEEEKGFWKTWCTVQKPKLYPYPIKFGEVTSLMSDILSAEFGEKVDLGSGEDTPEGRVLFAEKLREKLGFRPFSDFYPDRKKSAEVEELYRYLMQELHEGFTVTADGELEKGDLIRLLDHAYEHNNLHALLLIEIDQLAVDNNYLKRQDGDKLNQYISALKQEITQLKARERQLLNDPQYKWMKAYLREGGNGSLLQALINERLDTTRQHLEELTITAEQLTNDREPTSLLEMAESFTSAFG